MEGKFSGGDNCPITVAVKVMFVPTPGAVWHRIDSKSTCTEQACAMYLAGAAGGPYVMDTAEGSAASRSAEGSCSPVSRMLEPPCVGQAVPDKARPLEGSVTPVTTGGEYLRVVELLAV